MLSLLLVFPGICSLSQFYIFCWFFLKLVHSVHAYISHLEMHILNSNTKSIHEECVISEKT